MAGCLFVHAGGLGVVSDFPSRNLGGFHSGERKALREFARFRDFEALSKHPRISLASLRSLCAKGFAMEGQAGVYGPMFRLTDGGREAAAALDERPIRRGPGLSIEDVEIGVGGNEELEVVLIAGDTRTAIRLNAKHARRLAGELSNWAENSEAPQAA
jgi:hypothetical protein